MTEVDPEIEKEEVGTGSGKSPTRSMSIRVELDLIETAKKIGDHVGLGYQTVLKAAARVGLRQFVKAGHIELELPSDVPMPAPSVYDLEPEEDEPHSRPGPDEVVVHDRPLPRLR